MSDLEYRYAPLVSPESASGDFRVVEGTAVAYGDTATLHGFSERFDAGAFGDVSKIDVLANLHHDRTKPLARTNGPSTSERAFVAGFGSFGLKCSET